jgi:radical SAM protein with 4Fe4S-binding SPASM domain
MPLELYKEIARGAFGYTQELFLSCAHEPLMSRYFIDILEFTRQFNIPQTVLISNGLLLNEDRIFAIIESQLSTIIISIDGATKQTYEKIRKGGDFELLISNVKKLNEEKGKLCSEAPGIIFTAALMKSNIEESTQLIRLAHSLNIKKVNFKPMKVDVDEMAKESLLGSKGSVDKFIKEAKQVAREEGVELGLAPEFSSYTADKTNGKEKTGTEHLQKRCIEPFPSMYILPEGKVLPCTIWQGRPLGDFSRQGFEEIWEADEFSSLREELANGKFRQACRSCYYMCR